jgi:hypothetical protein
VRFGGAICTTDGDEASTDVILSDAGCVGEVDPLFTKTRKAITRIMTSV